MNTYEENYRIRYSEGDRYGRLKLRALFDFAQEAAGIHANLLGCGMELLHQRKQAWVLSRMKVRILHYPSIGETVTVKTWPSGFDRLFARREFQFTADDGKTFAEATSFWLIIDTAAMHILSAPKALEEMMPDNSALPLHFPELGKLPPADGPVLASYTILETLIDLNVHLNNAEYAAFVQDCLGPGVYPSELQINYQKSVPPLSQLSISGLRDASSFRFTGHVEETVAFEAAGTIIH